MTLPHVGLSISDDPTQINPEQTPVIRPPRLEEYDGEAMWRLARESGVLEDNAEYTYHMFSHFFGEACAVAEVDGEVVGFVAGFRPPDRRDTVFVWQIAVDHSARGKGLAGLMLRRLLARLSPEVHYLEATVTPSNEPSQSTFRALARDLGVPCRETVLFPGERFAGPSHEDEVLFRVGPFTTAEVGVTVDEFLAAAR